MRDDDGVLGIIWKGLAFCVLGIICKGLAFDKVKKGMWDGGHMASL